MVKSLSIGEIVLLIVMGLVFIVVLGFLIKKVSHSETRSIWDWLWSLAILLLFGLTLYFIFSAASTRDIIIVAVVFLIVSIIYMIYSAIEIKKARDDGVYDKNPVYKYDVLVDEGGDEDSPTVTRSDRARLVTQSRT